MNFIKKAIDGERGEEDVHLQFQKFGKGEFRDKALIKAKKRKNEFIISTTSEFANELVRFCAGKLGGEKVNVTGAVVSTNDLTDELDFKDKKQFQGVKRYIIDKEMSGDEIIELLDKFPKAFFALSFKGMGNELKIKPKAPKSAKPKNKGEAPKADFCKLKTTDAGFATSFVFEKPDFKDAEINHTFFITELVLPKDEEDFAKIREMAKRKGKIVRSAVIDGVESKKDYEFEA